MKINCIYTEKEYIKAQKSILIEFAFTATIISGKINIEYRLAFSLN